MVDPARTLSTVVNAILSLVRHSTIPCFNPWRKLMQPSTHEDCFSASSHAGFNKRYVGSCISKCVPC